ncbi:DUF4245 domain-containing protein [Streptomyces radicis]|uniref:DUF4245 domain-containing protein n=1 Tax=Streptomyces radicis TaxID=1750517 RepID=UPI001E51A557|nr:DUF4245 domain-containing protein [Streptomyces radicis]
MANHAVEDAQNDVAAAEDRTTGEAPRPSAGRRGLASVRNMVVSLVVICGGTFALVALNPGDQPEGSTPTVEYDVEAATAARAAPYELLVPEGLASDWRATSVRYEPMGDFGATWRLGFLDPDEEYAALAQADGAPDDFIEEITQGATDTGGTASVGGRDWARYEGDKYDALVLRDADVTTVVLGTAPFDRLTHFATALEPEPVQG